MSKYSVTRYAIVNDNSLTKRFWTFPKGLTFWSGKFITDRTVPTQSTYEYVHLWNDKAAAERARKKFEELWAGTRSWPRTMAPRDHFGGKKETPKYRVVEVEMTCEV